MARKRFWTKKRRRIWIRYGSAGLVTLCLLIWGYLAQPDSGPKSFRSFPVRGIDVSHHQGDIDWSRVARSGITFAFMKATEGVDMDDSSFAKNWQESDDAGIVRGAYLFYGLWRPGEAQARNFIQSVPRDSTALPPTIDLEFSNSSQERPPRSQILPELRSCLRALERHYGKKPILYVSRESYGLYIKGSGLQNPIWLCDMVRNPTRRDPVRWSVWQLTDSGRIGGIRNSVDLDVFRGTPEEFRAFVRGERLAGSFL